MLFTLLFLHSLTGSLKGSKLEELNSTTIKDFSKVDDKNLPQILPLKQERAPDAEKAEALRKKDNCGRCSDAGLDGTCIYPEKCFTSGGQVGQPCNNQLVCCTFINSCGDVTSEKVSYFQSPKYPQKSSGSLACDYDIFVQEDVCAVRIDFESVNLAGKLGGICDIDQLFILNSIDGPTSGQCGQLTGFSTTVAVQPSQVKPLKVALLIQNERFYHWFIKITQLPCEALNRSKGQHFCGRVFSDPNDFEDNNIIPSTSNLVWWGHPEPAVNTYYYVVDMRLKFSLGNCLVATKRHMQLAFHRQLQTPSERRIIDGDETRLGEFPWAAAISQNGMFFCGGAIISSLFVLTAAHCLLTRDLPIDSLAVHMGDYDLTSNNDTNHVTRKVKLVLFHSHFHPFLLANDITLVQLSSPVHFSIFIQPVCLPLPGQDLTWKVATVIGWGFTSFPVGEPSPRLRKLHVETISNVECAHLIEEPVSPGMICASAQHQQGTCFGDSGGPLTVTSKDGVNTLIGVVSFGISGCAMLPSIPDLYTRVSEYISWININTLL